MHYFFLILVKVNSVATVKANNAETIIYALKGIKLNPINLGKEDHIVYSYHVEQF